MRTYRNPIIPGFNPDPSICRVGEDYYLVTSSFEFFPGVPIWHSRDLTNWENIGHVLTTETQLPLEHCRTSGGIYAPTLRHHDGLFYMITTNTHRGGNFLVTAENILGPWSEPVWIDHDGIDPSLFWDEDGRVYYTGTWIEGSDPQGIGQFEIDVKTGKKLSDTRIIWYGTGGRCPEAPHMYKFGDWYYLMIAEGGTEYGHMVTIARSKNVWGPFESCHRNPILSHRDDICSPFQAVGHADITTDPQGNPYIFFHAIRPTNAQLHHIGRETMMAPFVWDNEGWPLVNGGKSVTADMTAPGEGTAIPEKRWQEVFSGEGFHPRWTWLRNPDRSRYEKTETGLTLKGSRYTLDDLESPTFIGARQRQLNVCYETEVAVTNEQGWAGITVFHTAEHHYDLRVSRKGKDCCVSLHRQAADMVMDSPPVVFENTDSLVLRITADKNLYTFHAGLDGDHLTVIGTGRTQLLSTEAMPCTFTGCFVGMFAEGDGEATFRYFAAEEK